MKLVFDRDAWAEYLYWQGENPKVLMRINMLIEECRRHPFKGTGKPEPLGGNLSGWWSRRVGWKQRLVYRVAGAGKDQTLQVVQCRYHY